MILLDGYMLGSTAVRDIESALVAMRERIEKKACGAYHELLAREIEAICDDAALGVLPLPAGTTILDAARESLGAKMVYAAQRQLPFSYNLAAAAQVMLGENGAYIRLEAATSIYREVLADIPDLQPYRVTSRDDTKNLEKQKVWTDVMARYENMLPLGVTLFPCGQIEVVAKLLVFRDVPARAKTIALHNLQNRLLGWCSQGGQIENHQLMRYLDTVMSNIGRPEFTDELKGMERQLRAILPKITYEMVSEATGEQ